MPTLGPPPLESDFSLPRAPEPAELLGPAPELREEFGTRAEHFQVPPGGQTLQMCQGCMGKAFCIGLLWFTGISIYIYTGYMGLHIRTACILMPSYIVEMGRSEICEDH